MSSRLAFVFSVVLACAFAAGCGQSKYPTARVSGRVTLNDKPLQGATVLFKPKSKELESGPDSFGKTDEDGRYTLELTTTGAKGAVIAEHVVRITVDEFEETQSENSDAAGAKPNPVPARYNIKTELSFKVPEGGSDKADFALKNP